RQLQNWRIQATSKLHQIRDEDFYYSAPMALSDEVASWIRQELPTFVEKINAKVIPSKSEVVRCLNIDWFEY
ncbi:MAG TPA: TIGR02147 family protein, partial [Bdellovibrio sp.]